jgi:drug/metabolite transporter (DMT)-like permease
MIYLVLSILASTLISLIFKYFDTYQIDNGRAILINYLTCILTGLVFYGSELEVSELLISGRIWDWATFPNWLFNALALGILFIVTFIAMAKTTQYIGVSTSVVSAKMAVVFPVLFGILYWNESYSVLIVLGVLLSLLGVFFIAYGKTGLGNISKGKAILFPILVFVGSGVIEINLKIIEKASAPMHWSGPTLIIFIGAFLSGLVYFIATGKLFQIRWRDVLGGIVLGVPNFFSILFVLAALGQTKLPAVTVLPVNNIGIVLLSTILSVLLFKEKLNRRNILGVAAAVSAILLMTLRG